MTLKKIIEFGEKETQAFNAFIDAALKAGGVSIYNHVQALMMHIKEEDRPCSEPPKDS